MNEVWAESWVRRVQIIQERRDRVVVRLVPADELLAKTRLPALKEKLQGVTGSDVEVVIVLQSEIPSAPAGKSRIYISLVNEPERKSDPQFTSGLTFLPASQPLQHLDDLLFVNRLFFISSFSFLSENFQSYLIGFNGGTSPGNLH